MAAGEDNKKNEQGKGFAGLSSLVSDVDATPPPAAKKPTISPTGTPPGASRPTPQAGTSKPQPAPQQPVSGSSAGKLWIGFAVVIAFFWLIGQTNKNTSPPAPVHSPPAHTTAQHYSPPAQPQAPTRPSESKPPVGRGLTLSREQIAYCVAEDIRLDGSKSMVDQYNGSEVKRFNAMVADYNSRCSNFNYLGESLNNVRQDIEHFREKLQAEGRARFDLVSSAQHPSTSPQPRRATSKKEVVYKCTQIDGQVVYTNAPNRSERECVELL